MVIAERQDDRNKGSEMPGFLGAGAEFLVNPQLPIFENEIVKINEITADRILLGHIVGGVSSSSKSVFFSNAVWATEASKAVFRVWLEKTKR